MMEDIKTISPVNKIEGTIEVGSDKSISHRSVIFASLANGESVIKNFLFSEDCVYTMKIMQQLGVEIIKEDDGTLRVKGVGLRGLKKPESELYCGNSGTGMRLMAGVLSAQDFPSVLTGDESLTGRPMRRITKPLTEMGALISASEEKFPPLEIKPGNIKGIEYDSPIASAQVKSCVLLAGLYSQDKTTVNEPFKSRDHTERMMQYLGIPVEIKGNSVSVTGNIQWQGKDIAVPGDFSSASFFISACLIVKGSSLIIKNLNLNPTRIGFMEVVKRMGADIEILNQRDVCNEPFGDIKVSYSDNLKGIEINEEEIPSIIDEVPLVALVASRAEGRTVINGAGELRKKESDRINSIVTQLRKIGQSLEDGPDTLVIEGRTNELRGAEVESFGDHRIAMMLAIAGLASKGNTVIKDLKCIDTSFPDFFDILESIIK